LILRKIIKFAATRCHILKLKYTKFDFGWGFAPDRAWGPHSAPPDGELTCSAPLDPAFSWIHGGLLLREGKGRGGEGKREGKRGNGGKGKGEKKGRGGDHTASISKPL